MSGTRGRGFDLATYNLEDVFVTEGVPKFTFVQPPNYVDILLDVRRAGKPVIIEGQSGTGKTTAVKRILEEINRSDAVYLSARVPEEVEAVEQIAINRTPGFYVIDDFHRLSLEIKEHLANIAKLAAEQGDGTTLPKLVIIGINQVGSDMIQLVPDIAKRTGIHRIRPGTEADIGTLVSNGCERLNVEFSDVTAIYSESQGDYWLAQQLCQSACAMSKVIATVVQKQAISIDVSVVRSRVVSKLEAAYYPAIKTFCRGRRFRPSNDPYYKLLRAISQQNSSVADLNELANALIDVRGSINNIKDRRLTVLLESKAECRQYFYYNADTKNFAIEDPALFYFLKHLNWDQLRSDCGFRDTAKTREWDVAISFAGENRELAKKVAEDLDFLDVHVFFDEYYENNYLGKAWSSQFKTIFADECDLVIVFLDAHHQRKIWPTFERDCFVSRVAAGEVIPIFLDDTIFVGIPKDIAAIHFKWDPTVPDWRQKAFNQIVTRLIDRIDAIQSS